MRKFLNSKGYTLVELLAVILILVSVGGIITAIITASLRGSNRSTNVNEVRQDGNFALTQMARAIRYAKSFEGVKTNGGTFTKDCTVTLPPAGTPTPTPIPYKHIKIIGFDGGETTFSCQDGSADNPKTVSSISAGLNSVNLISSGKVTITSGSCYFICNQQNSNLPPTIDINFTLSPLSQTVIENTVSIPFQTSVIFRNVSY